MSEVSSTRLYLGNLPRSATKADIEQHFASHGTGKITEVKLMNGFGFIEYEDEMDARDVVPAFHGGTFMGERIVVQFARGAKARRGDDGGPRDALPRPRRTMYRMAVSNLSQEVSWQDLKDFARQSGLDVVFAEIGRERDGRGFVEYETKADLNTAVEKLDGREFKGQKVHCVADDSPPDFSSRGDNRRSRSPRARYPMGGPRDDYYDRRGPRDYDYDYRRRSPPRDPYPYDRYDHRDRYARPPSRGPPPRRGPVDDYPPPRGGRYDDPYAAPPRGYDRGYDDMNGQAAHNGRPPYGGPPSPRRGRTPPPGGYEPRPRYW